MMRLIFPPIKTALKIELEEFAPGDYIKIANCLLKMVDRELTQLIAYGFARK